MTEVVITGISGFVGKNLAPHLTREGMDVEGLSLRSDREIDLPTCFSALIHLAGKAHDTKNTSVADDYFSINTGLTISLFDAFIKSNARDFIYFSSVKAVADSVDGMLNESAVSKPATPYGQSKWQAEEYLRSKQLPSGKRLFILRPCMIHGPGNKGNLNLLYQVVKKGIPYPLGAFENRRSFLSVQNLNFIVSRILSDPDIPGDTYNLSDDEALSTNELIRLISESLDKHTRIWAITPAIIRNAARFGDWLKLPLNSERLKKLTESYVVDNTKIKKALEVNTLPVTARDGLLSTLNSFSS